MPITLDDTKIVVQFEGGDPKGDSWGNPFTLDDIVAVSDEGSWDPAVMKQGIQYLIPYSLYIQGTDTYFLAEDAQVYFEYHDNANLYRLRVDNCNFKSQGDLHGMSWLDDWVYGYTSLYIRTEYGYIENTKFSRFETVKFLGSVSNNLIIKKSILIGCNMIQLAANNYVEAENISLFNLYGYGVIQVFDFVSAEDIVITDSPVGLYLYTITELNIRRLKLINVTNHLKFRPNKSGQVLNCFDSLIDFSKYNSYVTGTGDITANNISTFKINIANGDGGTAKLYDKDDNLVFSEVLSGELEKEVTFEMMEFDTVGGEITKELLTIFEPFKLVVSKEIYKDLIIPGIIINPGEQTRIFGKIVKPTYYQHSISGSVSKQEISGKVEVIEVSGTINT